MRRCCLVIIVLAAAAVPDSRGDSQESTWSTPPESDPSFRDDGLAGAIPSRPNIILILTDDQRWDTLLTDAPDYMPGDLMAHTRRELVEKGITFTQAFATTPICCPFRASLLSGGYYAHHTGVLTNQWPNGGATRFLDRPSLATMLQQKGYRTALIGKYLNHYAAVSGTDEQGRDVPTKQYVPPGWSSWVGMWSLNYTVATGGYHPTIGTSGPGYPTTGLKKLQTPNDLPFVESYFSEIETMGFSSTLGAYLLGLVSHGGDVNHDGSRDLVDLVSMPECLAQPVSSPASPCAIHDQDKNGIVDLIDVGAMQRGFGGWPYLTDFQRQTAVAFLEQQGIDSEPFFLLISAKAPHYPAVPAAEDASRYPGFTYRARSWGEANSDDKPAHVRDFAPARFASRYGSSVTPDAFFADQLRCLDAVDRLVRDTVEAVDQNLWLRDNTILIFTSDNGEMWGEHNLFSKGYAYEESIRVPLVMRVPGVPARSVDAMVAVNLDLPATILRLAGYTEEELLRGRAINGRDLMPLIQGTDSAAWRDFLLLEFWRRREPSLVPSWAAIRTASWKYVQYDYLDGKDFATELYDLAADPLELQNLGGLDEYADIRNSLEMLLEQERGLMIRGQAHPWGTIPDGDVGIAYEYALSVKGSRGLVTFSSFDDGSGDYVLPGGLSLTPDGVIHGTPTFGGLFEFDVHVEDSATSPHHGGPQNGVIRLVLRIR